MVAAYVTFHSTLLKTSRPANIVLMQKALSETLSLLGEPSREAVLLYLEKYHNISIDGPNNFTMEKLETALDTLFGSGQHVLMRKFAQEVRKYESRPKNLTGRGNVRKSPLHN